MFQQTCRFGRKAVKKNKKSNPGTLNMFFFGCFSWMVPNLCIVGIKVVSEIPSI